MLIFKTIDDFSDFNKKLEEIINEIENKEAQTKNVHQDHKLIIQYGNKEEHPLKKGLFTP